MGWPMFLMSNCSNGGVATECHPYSASREALIGKNE